MARPSTRSVNLKDGYYIELRRSGENKGMKVHRDTLEEVERAIKKYETVYNVVFLGRVEKGKVVDGTNELNPKKKTTKKAAAKKTTTKKPAAKKKTTAKKTTTKKAATKKK